MTSTQRYLIIIVSCAFFMEGLDSTIINTALPQIAHTLQTDPLRLKVALTAYLLAAGIIMPMSGWLADRFGCRRIFSIAILTFLIGSIACGLSQNLVELVIARIVQGIGGALSLPTGRLIFIRNFKKTELVAAMSLSATFGLLGPSFGPLIGGALTTYFDWRAIFFVNIPIGLIGLYFILKYIKNEPSPNQSKFDILGFILIGCSLSALLFGFDTLLDPIFDLFFTSSLIALGIIGLIAYCFYAKYHEHALISARLFEDRNFTLLIIGSIFVRLSISVGPFLVPLLLQVSFGYTAMAAGVLTAGGALGMLLTKTFVTKILKSFGHRQVLIVNSLFIILSMLLLSTITHRPPNIVIFLLIFINGVVASIQFTTMNTLSYGSLATHLQASGSSFISSLQQILSSFGIALAATVLELLLHSRTILNTHSPVAFEHTFWILALLPLIGSLIFMRLSKKELM